MQAKLSAEIGNRVYTKWPGVPVPPGIGGFQITLELLNSLAQVRFGDWLGGLLSQNFFGQTCKKFDRIVVYCPPELGVKVAENLCHLRMPAPIKILRQILQFGNNTGDVHGMILSQFRSLIPGRSFLWMRRYCPN